MDDQTIHPKLTPDEMLAAAEVTSNRINQLLGGADNISPPTPYTTSQMRIPQPNNGTSIGGNNGNNGGSTFTIKSNIHTPDATELRANTYSQNVNMYAKEYDRLMDRLNSFRIDVTGAGGKLARFRALGEKYRARSDVPIIVTAAMDVINEHDKMQKEYAQFFIYAEQWNHRQCDVIETLNSELIAKEQAHAKTQQVSGRLMQLIDSMALYVAKDKITDNLPIKDTSGNIIYVNVIANIQMQLADYAAKLKFFDDYQKKITDLETEKASLADKVAVMKSELSAKDLKFNELNDKYSILEKGLADKVNTLCRTLNSALNADDHGEPWEAPEHQPQPSPHPVQSKPYSSINPVQVKPAQFPRNSSAQAPTPLPATNITKPINPTDTAPEIDNQIPIDDTNECREFEVVPEEPELPVNYDGDHDCDDDDYHDEDNDSVDCADDDEDSDSDTGNINGDNDNDIPAAPVPQSKAAHDIPGAYSAELWDTLNPIERLILEKLNNTKMTSCTYKEILRSAKGIKVAELKSAANRLIRRKLIWSYSGGGKTYYQLPEAKSI